MGTSTRSCVVETYFENITAYSLHVVPNFFQRRVHTLLFDSHYLLFQSFDCASSRNNLTAINYICLLIGVISFCSRFLLGFFADLLILSFALTLFFLTISFINTLQLPHSVENSSEIFHHYKTLRILSRKINSVNGLVFLTYISEVIFAYPVNFNDLVWSPEILQRVLLILFYCITISILICSAEICRRVSGFFLECNGNIHII